MLERRKLLVKGHTKHVEVKKPTGGTFHRNEIAIMGGSCTIIQKLSQDISKELHDLKVGYIDADHGDEKVKKNFHKNYTDKIGYHQIEFEDAHLDHSFKPLLSDTDLALINGNHFVADKQIVIINQNKKVSLEKKLDRLTNVLFFIFDEGEKSVHSYLEKDKYRSTPIFSIQDVGGICNAIKKLYDESVPRIKGLVLAGGESMRMGTDKGGIEYHGKPQKEYAADLLNEFCNETFLSMKSDSGQEKFTVIEDTFSGLGPYGGILSAFRHDPNVAWLTVATDIPLLDAGGVAALVSKRNPSKYATCFHNPETDFPEPLFTLWEPRAYPRLLTFLSQGYTCPRKVLINSDVEKITVENPEILFNANTPDEMEAMKSKING